MSTSTYAYKVRDRSGALIEGTLEGSSEELVIAKLKEMGYTPVAVRPKARSLLAADLSIGRARVDLKSVVVFTRQLSTMLSSGLTILRALAILAAQTENKALAEVIGEMKTDIERGLSLSQAVGRHPKVFPPVYLSMIRAGETGGVLDTVMRRLADTMEKQLELRGKVKSAMSYPVAVFGLVILIVTAMLIFVVPMFEGMYENLEGELPKPTKVLVGLSDFVKKTFWAIGAVGVVLAVAFRRWKATPRGRLAVDRLKLRLPVFGTLVHKTAIARFTRTFASLMRSGVPIMEALDIVAETAGNVVVTNAVQVARERVSMGESVSAALVGQEVFPPMVVQMMAVGEETGALDHMLEKIADFYDREVSATVDALTSLIEPLLMVFMGATVGGMVVALYLPMFQIINLVK